MKNCKNKCGTSVSQKHKICELKQTTLASELQFSYEHAHDAFANFFAMENVLNLYYTDDE